VPFTVFDELLQHLSTNPYLAVFVLMILCGLGLPIPEEIILVGAGYISYLGKADPLVLGATSAGAILAGDLLPFLLGRLFGPKILRIRLVRTWISKEKLALFDHWFQRRGWLTIFVARFIPGIRTPAFFTAGSMRLAIPKFLLIDGAGVLFSVPLSLGLGYHFGDQIDRAISLVHRTEKGLLILAGASLLILTGVFWYRIHRRRKLLGSDVREAFVGPSEPGGEADLTGEARPGSAPAEEETEAPPTPESRLPDELDSGDGPEAEGARELPRAVPPADPSST